MVIRLNAGNDTNGNPRRVYVHLDKGGAVTGAWDEGYQGTGAVPKRLRRQAMNASTFDTTPGEYRSILKVWTS